MEGYADDGYCREGVGYYNLWLLGHLSLLREEVCRATQGQIDFFLFAEVRPSGPLRRKDTDSESGLPGLLGLPDLDFT